ncbi:hypothetical protein [Stenotrophomonas ginsengisoli]|uniref:hypothetical protein n=2 Tax=Stenotrophomonas ginsengisoli TaxID=336566 RepID=UPI00137A18A4|nr:hypothetical protein [Stenotrophomonas ginsengisoli]
MAMRLHTSMLLLVVALLAGCATAMPASLQASGLVADRLQMDTRPRVVDGNPLPLRFVRHDFAVHVYDTLAFYVEYNGDGFFASNYRNTRSPSYADSIPRERWPTAGYSSVANWPGPVKLRWTSLDGVEHTAEIDFPRIFADGLTLHAVPDNELPAGMYRQGISTDPEIHLEVDNRTVRVYQRARMSTRTEQVPGNRYTRNRSDLFLVAEYQY